MPANCGTDRERFKLSVPDPESCLSDLKDSVCF